MRRNRRALSDQERAVQGLQRRIGQFNVVARRMSQGLGVLAAVGAGAAVRAFSNFPADDGAGSRDHSRHDKRV